MLDVLKIKRRRGNSSRTYWSNRFLVGLGRIISLHFLTFLNLWIFVLLLVCKGDFFCIYPVY
jgi:hypothetical protein